MRVLFAGTPAAAVPSLRALAASAHEVVAVLTRPDAPAGRGRALLPSAVRTVADELGIEVLTPPRLRDEAFRERLAALDVEAAAVVAYGALVPPDLLAAVPHGWVNLHFSLLPAWRGAAPVQHAVIAGDEVTGATTFLLEQGLDTGPVYGLLTETIRPRDTAGDLLGRLAEAGAGLLVRTLDGIEDGTLVAVPQERHGVSLAPKLTPDDARVRWTHPAVAVDRRIRGCTPEPGAWTTLPDGARLGLGPVTLTDQVLAPGLVVAGKHDVVVGTATQAVRLGEVTPTGKRTMPAADWARGARLAAGTVLGQAS
ncbi:MAG: methionyl-tRNA formyltransferase [Cellulomonas sp. 73-92]|uniref:methionyl-tRNA formyltransferase n=1 Tax=Cellulomonas sp. 73-92 TaxID=1895740 RepID=UPI000927EBC3|nr:methionyl-tRNA formyltransferase [Cellulomonas sp. 73-92]OJV80315.1 MAG: methionyl-tRNA formyltransferase [Cellulomonas sp. 73-92]